MSLSFSQQKLVKFTMLLILQSHWMACVWGLVGLTFGKDLCDAEGVRIDLSDDPLTADDVSWVTELFVNGKFSPDSPCIDRHVYIAALHWSVMTVTSIGYGDIIPVRHIEYIVAILCMLTGGVLWTYVIGSSCSIISNVSPVEEHFRTSIDLLNQVMEDKQVPAWRRPVYREYLREARMQDSRGEFQSVAQRFSPLLRQELMFHLSESWIGRVYYFKSAPPDFVLEVTDSLDMMFFSKQETVHGVSSCLCAIERGTIAHNGRVLMRGQVFGLDFIIDNWAWRKVSKTVAITYSMLLLLRRERFDEICLNYPSFDRCIRRCALSLAMVRAVRMCALSCRKHKADPTLPQLTLPEAFDTLDVTSAEKRKSAMTPSGARPPVRDATRSQAAVNAAVEMRLDALQEDVRKV
eukprot:CAMPEP_0180421792 /NCGR_PEP_ID=MMETSP1036_2-20121128/3338_1 /TAXON_ID=632150 /ORGANISM="Azadinium spinosum, Strain 3D9" /LENGTH=406 /DNA_ID=CAMNT_0022427077 /DNA_START=1 /DNA_END=1218 /DNA_ORIENTATION=+